MSHEGIAEIPAAIRDEMRGRSWHEHLCCPSFDALRLLTLRHRGFDGSVQRGELIVAAEVAHEVVQIFEQLFAADFPIERMQRIDRYAGDDDASMAANNCSAFNFRVVEGTDRLSYHALGLAIDINPVQNPWLRPSLGRVDPLAGREYLDRTHVRPGMIVPAGPVVAAFAAAGWRWDGELAAGPDYHHFCKPPR
jgi:poly-gamma-glutamate synthesis protein (capsule biosynthesis protein)